MISHILSKSIACCETISRQECITVEYIPSAALDLWGGGGVSRRVCVPREDVSQGGGMCPGGVCLGVCVCVHGVCASPHGQNS